ncbi:hypothetical protein ACJX0J_016747, partial [Zea mays]
SIIEVLGIVNQGQRNPSRAGGLVANMESEGWDPLKFDVNLDFSFDDHKDFGHFYYSKNFQKIFRIKITKRFFAFLISIFFGNWL